MTKKVMELRGLIYAKYNSESEFAQELGWNRQRLNRITTGEKIPDLDEINEIAIGLEKSIEEIAKIFLRHKSPNEQQNRAG